MLTPLLTAGIETALNALLYRDRALQTARMRLAGKVLAVTINELDTPLFLLFGERQVDVLGRWEDEADCRVATRLGVLPELRDRQQLAALIRSGDLNVDGDIQVIQQFVALIDLAEWDPAEMLAPYTGDVVAQGISITLRKGAAFLRGGLQRQQRYLAEALTEEWRLAPGALEVAWFNEEVDAVMRSTDVLDKRLEKLEEK